MEANDRDSTAKCSWCKKKVPWTAEGLVCKCGLIFCDKHRFPEDHRCTFNYHEEHKAKLRRENPRVVMQGHGAFDYKQFSEAHRKQHPDRGFLRFHSAGLIIFALFSLRGLWYGLGDISYLFQQLLIGYVVGFLIAHTLPAFIHQKEPNRLFYSSFTGGCRCCFFSWDLISSPKWVLQCESDALLQIALGLVTANGTNCLGYLNTNPSWGKTVDGVYGKVAGARWPLPLRACACVCACSLEKTGIGYMYDYTCHVRDAHIHSRTQQESLLFVQVYYICIDVIDSYPLNNTCVMVFSLLYRRHTHTHTQTEYFVSNIQAMP